MNSQNEQYTSPVLQKWQASDEDKNLFFQFTRELTDWHATGKEPISADQSLRYSLDLQEARLKKHNIKKALYFKKLDDYVINRGNAIPRDPYSQGMNVAGARIKSEYTRQD